MSIRIILIAILSVLFRLDATATCTPHTVSMTTGGTGENVNAFTSDGNLGGDNGIAYFVHWDGNYLYLGWNGGTTSYSSDLYYAALDVTGGGSTGSIEGASFSEPVMDYYVVYENNASFYGVPASNGDAFEVWQAVGNNSWTFVRRQVGANDGIDGRITFGAGAGAEARIRIPWSDVGGMPSSFTITMWVNQGNGGNVFSSYPSQNPTGNGITLSHGVSFSSTGSGICPASAQFPQALPVELTSFAARSNDGGINLDWSTASELNNSHFDVQRSGDSRSWETIGMVEGRGTTLEEQEYSFTDRQPLPGMNYYRLKQVDFDGAFEYSKVVSVDFSQEGRPGFVAPNPVGEELWLTLPDWEDGTLRVSIFDLSGRIWVQGDVDHRTLDVGELPAGIYLIRVLSENGQRVLQERFVKQ